MDGDICVIGSLNMDFIVETTRAPEAGETIVGKTFTQLAGGKGANQAYTIGKLGSKVNMIGACGSDSHGQKLLDNLSSNGVNVEDIYKLKDSTGIAFITVEDNSENRIVIIPGANKLLTPQKIKEKKAVIESSSILLIQLEIPVESVVQAVKIANSSGVKVVLDPAPVKKLPLSIYNKIDYLLPNEGELDLLVKRYNLNSEQEKVKKLLNLGVGAVLVTKGDEGVSYYDEKKQQKYNAQKVKAVDTTAAGDAFAGAFTFGIHQKWSLDKSINFGNKVAGITVTKLGAQISIPNRDDLENYSKRR